MGKFLRKSTEFWPLIDVKKSFLLSIFEHILTDFLQSLHGSLYGDRVFGQIEENEAYNNMQANIMPLQTTLTPRMGLKCHFFPLKSVLLHIIDFCFYKICSSR